MIIYILILDTPAPTFIQIEGICGPHEITKIPPMGSPRYLPFLKE